MIPITAEQATIAIQNLIDIAVQRGLFKAASDVLLIQQALGVLAPTK